MFSGNTNSVKDVQRQSDFIKGVIQKNRSEAAEIKAKNAAIQAERDLIGLSKIEGYAIVPKSLIQKAVAMMMLMNGMGDFQGQLRDDAQRAALTLAKFGCEKVEP